ncbi:hypothetical protein ASPWEDRAFT_309158 [Aspergillus wentii DTO 134E9]|uniref:Amino acid permease/ SLC12A domain-containing protein n=1 Tax=Aspergillus wentii DTO 134E9 TaxID=1073089 RepID=A0A1L9RTC2_ASPWE|nr:uncharacterized protein ASPWEDRAFT_309158 [Aspergillus wentii DTO 134E9]OJJ38057.1 hypothetical protein ASPWEDRAFT_309158 [Aspergillus wentii DTO 134E9]
MIGTAIFSVPSSISASVGSAGAALCLWAVGFILSLSGLMIWLELGCLLPRSGGEKVYLETAYRRPPLLATTIYATHVIFLGFTGNGSIAVAENLLLAVSGTANDWTKRCIAIAVLVLISFLHIKAKTFTVKLMNVLASVKILILVIIILAGLWVLGTDQSNPRVPHPGASFNQPFAGSSSSVYDYSNALFKIIATYQGWTNAGYVLDEVKNPRRTLKMAGVLGVGSVGILYILVNMAYYAVCTPEELSQTGVTVVALFIGKVFGETMQWCTALLAATSTFATLLTGSFTMSRVIQSLAKEGVLPFTSFFAGSAPSGSPNGAFLALFATSAAMIILMPFGEAYNFTVDVGQYAMAIIYFAVVVGLFIIRKRTVYPHRTFRVWTSVACLFMAMQTFLVLSPFLHNSASTSSSIPFWLMPIVAILALSGGIAYWYGWFILLPRIKGFVWEKKSSTLADGTEVVVWTKDHQD